MTENKTKASVSKAAVGFVHACMTAPPTGDVTHSMALMFDTHTAALRNERDVLAAQVKIQRAALEEIDGCFEAALAEGLLEAIVETPDVRLRDLLNRRLLPARGTAVGALSATPALPASPPDDWQVANDELRSMRDAALDKAFDLAALVRVLRDALAAAIAAAKTAEKEAVADDLDDWFRELRGARVTGELALATTGPAALAEVRARLFEEAAGLVQAIIDDPKERASCALAVMTLKGCAMSERAKIGQQAQEGAADA